MFHYFLSDDRKQDAYTTSAHSKHLISLSKNKKLITKSLSTIWGKNDGCEEQYRCAYSL